MEKKELDPLEIRLFAGVWWSEEELFIVVLCARRGQKVIEIFEGVDDVGFGVMKS